MPSKPPTPLRSARGPAERCRVVQGSRYTLSRQYREGLVLRGVGEVKGAETWEGEAQREVQARW